jgi:hypothetical protein
LKVDLCGSERLRRQNAGAATGKELKVEPVEHLEREQEQRAATGKELKARFRSRHRAREGAAATGKELKETERHAR